MVPCKTTAEEVSFEWSHHRILSTDSEVTTTLHVFRIDSESERVKHMKDLLQRRFKRRFGLNLNCSK